MRSLIHQCLLGLRQASVQAQDCKGRSGEWPFLEPLLIAEDAQGKGLIRLRGASIFLLDYNLSTFDVKYLLGQQHYGISWHCCYLTSAFLPVVQGRRWFGRGSMMDFQQRNSRSWWAPLAQREVNRQCDPKEEAVKSLSPSNRSSKWWSCRRLEIGVRIGALKQVSLEEQSSWGTADFEKRGKLNQGKGGRKL